MKRRATHIASGIICLMLVLFWYNSHIWASDRPLLQSPPQSAAVVRIYNRTVAEFRVPFMGIVAEERAKRAEGALRRLLEQKTTGNGKVTLQPIPQGYTVALDDVFVFVMLEGDADPLKHETLEQAGKNAVAAIEQIVLETREARNFSVLLKAGGYTLAATLVAALLIWMLNRTRRWLATRLVNLAHRQAERLTVGGESFFQRERLLILVQRGVTFLYWLLVLILLYDWLSFVLTRFPYTRPWGERLSRYLLDLVQQGGIGLLKMVPDLVVSLFIFLIARFIVEILKTFFDRIEQHKLEMAWLDCDTVRPTRRLVSAGVWLFALVMAYPYLPGSGTEAFKGLSVLVGLMISLGASSLVGQAASGLILMYTRTIRPGEFVQIASNEGTVVELGLFTTRILTGLGEELTMPNSLILSNVTRNYSRTVKGNGYIMDTTVTIGYDTPWRQVNAMLIEAANRTPGVLRDPKPQVFQTALSDFYPEYRLVCQAVPEHPKTRAELLDALHANIQDLFNEYGVQIMSPHYLYDPPEPKVVPKEHWAPPPAGGNMR